MQRTGPCGTGPAVMGPAVFQNTGQQAETYTLPAAVVAPAATYLLCWAPVSIDAQDASEFPVTVTATLSVSGPSSVGSAADTWECTLGMPCTVTLVGAGLNATSRRARGRLQVRVK